MFSTRFAWSLTVVVSLAASGPLFAQDAAAFTGVVNSDGVNIRAGAGQNYYVVSTVPKGSIVEVQELLFGWYKILTPPGSFSFVAKQFVKANGADGVIAGQGVRVHAPSPEGPGNSYRTQMLLKDGDKVKIVGEQAEYYKIVPPAGAVLFVAKEFVERATPEQIAAAKAASAPPAPVAPAVPVTPAVPVIPVAPAQV